jgi:homopolymeric O-antigen transport system permease protein
VAVDTAPRATTLPGLGRLAGYNELLWTLFRREVRVRYKGSALGLLWSVIYPISMMLVYTLIFSVLWKTAGNIPHYPLFVLVGLAVWGFFQASVQLGSGSLVSNAELIKKIWFPRELIPTSTVLAQTISAGVMFAILIPIALVVEPKSARTLALAVPIFAGLLCLTLGFSMLLAVANVFFRDIEHLLGVIFLPWFFLTPVLYGLEQLPAAATHRWAIELLRYGNPVTPYVEGMRSVVLFGVVPGTSLLLYIFLVGPAFAIAGLRVLRRYEDRLAVEL